MSAVRQALQSPRRARDGRLPLCLLASCPWPAMCLAWLDVKEAPRTLLLIWLHAAWQMQSLGFKPLNNGSFPLLYEAGRIAWRRFPHALLHT